MSLTELPDVALIKIFRTLNHVELVDFYKNFSSSKRLQNLIHHSSCLWTCIHIKSTVDYTFFTCFIRLLISNASTIRELIIDELDVICRKILMENGFSFKKFSLLEQLIIHDEDIGNTLQSIQFCSTTLKCLYLINDHIIFNQINCNNQLNSLQLTLHSMNIFLRNHFDFLTNLHLKIMFDHDHQSHQIFSHLPNRCLESLKLKFLLLNNDANFSNEFIHYLNSCYYLHTLELSYLHGMCPLSLYRTINYSKYRRMILINICRLDHMEELITLHQYSLPSEYFQWNSTSNSNRYSSCIQTIHWHTCQLISVDYVQCVTTSIELFNEFNIIWSDKNGRTQSFESYILRSIYNVSHLIVSLRNLIITKFELSLDGLVTLMINLPFLIDFIISDGKIDQMGSGICDLKRILDIQTATKQSVIQTIIMNNIHLSRRAVVKFCFITQQLISLTMHDVKLLDRISSLQDDLRPNFLIFLKQIAQETNQFRWSNLKSLTLGKNMINRQNLCSFFPSYIQQHYATNLNHLRLIIHDQRLFEPTDRFLKSMKKLIRIYSNLTSFIIEFTHKYDEHYLLRNQIQTVFERNFNKKVYVYSTKDDRAFRFCFDQYIDDDQSSCSSQKKRTFCGIPLFQSNKQRKFNVFS
ncbi:hypothetical protein I4U23_007617 [Adineta vaga]|nr:hypothetical protein I4U23_007617 [Adineta vaga]